MNLSPDTETTGSPNVGRSGGPPTILLVEDDDNDAALLQLMFKRSKILNRLQVVTSVADALSYLKGEGRFADRRGHPFPILMIVDSHLNDGSGFDILRWLQSNKARRPHAVVMLTGSDVRAFKASYDLGAQSFLTKPLKFEDVRNMVQHVHGLKLTSTPDGHLLDLQ